MPALSPQLRNQLERTVTQARAAAEHAVKNVLAYLGVEEDKPFAGLSEDQRQLRRTLREEQRRLGSAELLTSEGAYEQWHQMLFAHFLAENDLLIHPDYGQSVTLEECKELAKDEGDRNAWAAAARYAAAMLPGIFHPDDPLLKLELAADDTVKLEHFLESIPRAVFTSDDGLGWLYQFWQAQAKKEVNASGRKIGGADIGPVTQLFTEHYMVQFLLHNTLGAWWAARHPETPLPTEKSYLRNLPSPPRGEGQGDRRKSPWDEGECTPIAGTFDAWPDEAKDLKILDPCCGSGHFLVAAFALLVRFRMLEENLSEAEAGDAVLRDNLFGLELDPRCTQLAAFNLALAAWKSGGYRPLPLPHIACSGVAVGAEEADWTKLAGGDPRTQKSLARLYTLFKNAPDLGSLIDPTKLGEDDPLYTAHFDEVEALLGKALNREKAAADPAAAVFGEAARGVVRAAELLRGKYHLVVTNVPYLARGKQDDVLKDHIERAYKNAKADLATAFVLRCRDFCITGGSYALVTPQNWLFLGSYKKMREELLKNQSWNTVARLGTGAFGTISGEVVNVALLAITNARPAPEHLMTGLEASDEKTPEAKAEALRETEVKVLEQAEQLKNPDFSITLIPTSGKVFLSRYADCLQGISSTDYNRFGRAFWEMPGAPSADWVFQQGTVVTTAEYAGREHILKFGELERLAHEIKPAIRGSAAWQHSGVALAQMRELPATLYTGEVFINSVPVVIPHSREHLAAIWTFCSSDDFNKSMREQNAKLSVDNGYIGNVPFDLEHWQKVAAEKYPNGLPELYSDDPTQWLFHGHPVASTAPLQVATARLLGYRWPAETDAGMELSAQARSWIARCETLLPLADGDGIVCLNAVAGELPAEDRLRKLLARAYGARWSATVEQALLAATGYEGKSLGEWLRDGFFAQHCKLFGNRPFLWHVWDGRKDGFAAILNYHKLDRVKLERFIYTYLGAYLAEQRAAAQAETVGADLRRAAAQELKGRLEAILTGEPPYDIYVRWKPLAEQPIGWAPDVNDGVRLNVRPWVTAGVLRRKFTVKWSKDRGKDPRPNASGTVERLNDLHFARAEKEAAREEAEAVK